jgi:hypothetical protein
VYESAIEGTKINKGGKKNENIIQKKKNFELKKNEK